MGERLYDSWTASYFTRYQYALRGYVEFLREHLPFTCVLRKLGLSFRMLDDGDLMRRCVFHGEKTPSLHIYTHTNLYHCHACGETGDAFRFVRKYLGSRRQAIKFFQRHFGIKPPKHHQFYLARPPVDASAHT